MQEDQETWIFISEYSLTEFFYVLHCFHKDATNKRI